MKKKSVFPCIYPGFLIFFNGISKSVLSKSIPFDWCNPQFAVTSGYGCSLVFSRLSSFVLYMLDLTTKQWCCISETTLSISLKICTRAGRTCATTNPKFRFITLIWNKTTRLPKSVFNIMRVAELYYSALSCAMIINTILKQIKIWGFVNLIFYELETLNAFFSVFIFFPIWFT